MNNKFNETTRVNIATYKRLGEKNSERTLDDMIQSELTHARDQVRDNIIESEYTNLKVLKHINEDTGDINDSDYTKKEKIYFAKINTKIKNAEIIIGDIVNLLTYKPIYIKKAIGKDGKEINVYKIRTMVRDADKYLPQILNDKNSLNHQGKIENDPRITKLGSWMRKYHLDELPQIYNVLILRNMKWVGIRPMELAFWKNYSKDIYDEAIKEEPGFFGVNYYSREDEGIEHEEVLRTYQKEHKIYPEHTEKTYLRKILYNKLIKREHSS